MRRFSRYFLFTISLFVFLSFAGAQQLKKFQVFRRYSKYQSLNKLRPLPSADRDLLKFVFASETEDLLFNFKTDDSCDTVWKNFVHIIDTGDLSKHAVDWAFAAGDCRSESGTVKIKIIGEVVAQDATGNEPLKQYLNKLSGRSFYNYTIRTGINLPPDSASFESPFETAYQFEARVWDSRGNSRFEWRAGPNVKVMSLSQMFYKRRLFREALNATNSLLAFRKFLFGNFENESVENFLNFTVPLAKAISFDSYPIYFLTHYRIINFWFYTGTDMFDCPAVGQCLHTGP